MRRKLLVALVVLSSVLIGCSGGEVRASKDPHETTSRYYDCLRDGNIEDAIELCEPTSNVGKELQGRTREAFLDEMADIFSANNEEREKLKNNKFMNKFYEFAAEGLTKSYQIIKKTDEDENTVTYLVSVQRMTDDSLEMFLHSITLEDSFEQYYSENTETVERLINERGEGAVIMDYIDKNGRDIADEYISKLKEQSQYEGKDYYVSLSKQDDGRWLISDIERR